jgi:hypothetical protein
MTNATGYIFISHSHADDEAARNLNQGLRAAGFQTWIDQDDIDPAEKWAQEIERAVENCGAFLVLMSRGARASEWVENEILFAQRLKKPVFVALIDDVRLPIYLMNTQYVDFRAQPAAALKRLVRALGKITFAAPPPEPVGPVDVDRLTPQLDWPRFQAYLKQGPGGEAAASAAKALYTWARQHADAVDFRGSDTPALHARVTVAGGEVTLFSVWAYRQRPAAEVPLQYLSAAPPYDQRAQREAALARLNALLPEGERFATDRADKRPGLPLAGTLEDAARREAFLALMGDMAAALRAAQSGSA